MCVFIQLNPTHAEPSISRQVPTDGVLKQIANKINKRDWHMLANKLGFTSPEISNYERKSSSKKEQVQYPSNHNETLS